jgi:hypothetical protein
MNLSTDNSAFLVDFAQTMTRVSDSASVSLILDRPYAEELAVTGERITGQVSLPSVLAVDDELLTSEGEYLAVVSVQQWSDRGLASVVLESRGYQVDIPALSGLRVTWLDEEYPEFPAADTDPPVHDPALLTLRMAPQGRILFQAGPIHSTVVPAHARIDSASLWMFADSAFLMTWRTHHVLASVDLDFLNWAQATVHHPWSEAGCSDEDVDFDSTIFTRGTSVAKNWNEMATGQGFAALLDATRTGLWFLIRSISGSEGTFQSELATNPHPPYLRLRYTVPRV